MNQRTYSDLRNHYKEVFVLEPNDLHFPLATKIFKKFSPLLKIFPFRVFVPLSVLGTVLLYILFGAIVIRLVTVLQYGF